MQAKVKKLVRKAIPKQALRTVEQGYRQGKARTAVVLHGNPAKRMRIIAVTGTNGKTTTCAYVNQILKTSGYVTAVYSTAFTEIAGVQSPNRTHMTVASAWSVQQFLRKAAGVGVDAVVLEVTSHALDQYRILGVPVEVAVVTNLTQDHLDYHGTMDAYAAAKRRLLTDYAPKHVVLNADDEWYDYFAKAAQVPVISVGAKNATNKLSHMHLSPTGTDFALAVNAQKIHIHTHLVGEFNVYNAAQAVSACLAFGCSSSQVVEGVKSLPMVPGRLESVDAGQGFSVLVDYAHTPDALQNVLTALQAVTKGSVRIVFGATGDRDKKKRPLMGEVAARHADMVYLTDDETYSEDPQAIRDAVRQGLDEAKGKYVEIGDRYQAITQAFKDAKPGDVVLLAGIGHQDYRAMGDKKMPWDEREIAREVLDTLQ